MSPRIAMPPFGRSLPVVLSLAGLFAVAGAAAAEPSTTDFVVPVVSPPTAATLETARGEARKRLATLRGLFAEQAIGVVLSRELDLDGLEAAVSATEAAVREAEGPPLDTRVRTLRRTVPPSLQPALDGLRASVDRLARLVRLAADDEGVARASLATLARHVADPGRRRTPEGEAEVRAAFARAAALLPDDVVAPLGRRLSYPNDVGFVHGDFIAHLARQRIDQPLSFARRVEGAWIAGTGHVTVDLSATVAESVGENLLDIHARGAGTITATADRRRVHVRASARPTVTCTQTVHILPRSIAGDTPDVSATFRTDLVGLGIDGVLGRCGLVQRLAGRAIGDALAANDPRVAATLEEAVRDRVREEGLQLAHRVNGLLRSTVWDQLRAVDYEPSVALYDDAAGIWSETTYAHHDELASLTPRPALSPGARHDVVRWVHESAVTNALGGLAAATVDEATVRGLWETQFKLSSPEWEALPGGREPASILLADRDPIAVRFMGDGIALDVRATACHLDGRRVDAGTRHFRIRYRVQDGPTGLALVRDEIEFADDVPADARQVWERVLSLFCGREILPLPRFPNRKARQVFRLARLEAADGWLVVGLERASDAAPVDDGRSARADGGVHR